MPPRVFFFFLLKNEHLSNRKYYSLPNILTIHYSCHHNLNRETAFQLDKLQTDYNECITKMPLVCMIQTLKVFILNSSIDAEFIPEETIDAEFIPEERRCRPALKA